MTSLVSQEPGLATIPESPTGEGTNSPHRMRRDNGGLNTMPQYGSQNGSNGAVTTTNGYTVDGANNSPNSSQLSSEPGMDATLISRTQKQYTTQQVTTTTKTIREIQYLGPDGQPLDFVPAGGGGGGTGGGGGSAGGPPPAVHQRLSGSSYEQFNGPAAPRSNGGTAGFDPRFTPQPGQPTFGDYEQYGGPPHQAAAAAAGNYAEYPHRPPTPPSPGDRSASPPPQHQEPDYMRQGGGSSYPPRSGYEELDTTLMPPRPGEQYGQAPAGMPPQGPPGLEPRYSSADDQPSSLQGSLAGGVGYDPNLNNSVFEDSGSSSQQQPMYQQHQPLQQQYESPQLSHYPPRAHFDEEDAASQQEPPPLMQRQSRAHLGSQSSSRGAPGVQWRDPDLGEVIEFLNNPNSVIKANAAAYLQHLCYMDDPVKAKTRQLGGIPPLVELLSNEIPEIHRNACGALRNLSYGRQNDENKRAIKAANGVTALVRLLRKTGDNDIKDLVTGVLWNLSSCDDLKRAIIDEALLVLVNIVIIPHSGWKPVGPGEETLWSTVFRNSSGILRNISSAGDYGRKKLRECEGLVDSILYLVKKAIEKANIDNKSVENCVCVLRNLSYRAQEVEDPNYDKRQILPGESRAGAKPTTDNLGCFGASKAKRKDGANPNAAGQTSNHSSGNSTSASSRGPRTGPIKGMELLWTPEVVQPYLNLLSNCSNPETLEAAAGAIQNLSACYWQPSIDVRAAVRKEKGLPILVELLRMEVDRVVCAVATALRNLAIDQRNKELIGKYAMRDLVQKLPSGNPQHDNGTSDDTIAAVLATLNEVIKKHPEFSRSLLEAGGVERLMQITRQRQRFSSRVVKFASQVLYSMWVHQELREVYRKAGWKEQDFVTKTIAARNARPNSPTNMNSTLNRPMASQSATRYEDRTMQRGAGSAGAGPGGQGQSGGVAQHANNSAVPGYRPDDVPMENLSLYGRTNHMHHQGGQQAAAPGMVMYSQGNHHVRPGEPVYAQVDREKKKHSRSQQQQQQQQPSQAYATYAEHADHWQVANHQGVQLDQQQPQQPAGQQSAGNAAAAGDSWV